jgi:hypothetical protein
MEDKRGKNKTMAERVYNANVLPDGNLNSIGLFDVVIHDLENTGNVGPLEADSDTGAPSSPIEDKGDENI